MGDPAVLNKKSMVKYEMPECTGIYPYMRWGGGI